MTCASGVVTVTKSLSLLSSLLSSSLSGPAASSGRPVNPLPPGSCSTPAPTRGVCERGECEGESEECVMRVC